MWAAAEPLLPVSGDDHPLGCHNPRIPDRVCFEGIVIRLVTGCSWVTAERLIAHRASDTTLRARRDEWAAAGVFGRLRLHCNENRWHLQRSLRIGRSQSRVQRLIVIASVRNLFDPDSWVALLLTAKLIDWRNRWSPQ